MKRLKNIELFDGLSTLLTFVGFMTVLVGAFSGTWLAWPCGIFLAIYALIYMLNERAIDEREWKHLSDIERYERIMRGKTPWNK